MADDVFDLDKVRASFIQDNPMEYRKLKLYDREWRVRMEIVGSVEHAYSADQALRAAKQAGFIAPVVGEWRETQE